MAGFLGNQPSAVPLTSADIADGTITNDDLAGSITDAKISALSASKLTGSIADARVPSSAVTQHVTATDLAPVRSDILKLAIHSGIDGNRAAFNLDDSFIDTFEDETGITTETNVDRDATGEYVNSIFLGTSVYVTGDRRSTITATSAGSINPSDGAASLLLDGDFTSSGDTTFYGNSVDSTRYVRFQFDSTKVIDEAKFYQVAANSYGVWKWQGSDDASTWTDIGASFTLGGVVTQTITTLSANTTSYLYYQILGVSGTMSATNFVREFEFKTKALTTSATGTLISDPQTASTSRTSASGVIIYEDADGTNTLGTDLKIYFSCNNSAWTEASSYGTATTYSGTKKLVKLGSTTVTAGTQVAMKAEWANQATESAASQLLIAQNVGTAIGNMTTNGGLAASFNGNKNQAYAQNSVCQNGNGPAFIGKDWGSGNTKTISGIKIWGSNETGYSGVGAAINFYLYGSNSAPTGTADGTLISTLATNLADVNGTNALEYLTGIDVTTAYRYHWFTITTPSSVTAQVIMCEIEFYALGTDAVAGKEVRLHGWAVNY
jgi:hypothetical protein